MKIMKRNPQSGSSFFGYGVSQSNRPLKALDPNYAPLDNRSTAELLAYATELSKYIKYYNLDNKEDGTWEPFFLSDISVITALIITTDLKLIEDNASSIINEFYKSESLEIRLKNYAQLRKMIFKIFSDFDYWYKNILRINLVNKPFESIVETELYNLISRRIIPYFEEFLSNYNQSQKDSLIPVEYDLDFENFHSSWNADSKEANDVFFGKSKIEKITSGMLTLRLQFKNLFQSLGFAIKHFQKYFDRSLLDKEDHNPDIALFLGFLQTFKFVQNDFNSVAERFQYFYYNNILKMNHSQGTSDYVFIHFTLNQNTERFVLKEGTKLIAPGTDDKEQLTFRTVDSAEITRASIESLRTIYCSRLDDLDTSNYKITSHIYQAPVANSRDGFGQPMENKYDSWPIFGEEQEYKAHDKQNMGLADLGWAFSSPVLHLSEGTREIKIRLNFIPESTRIFKRLVYDVYNKVNDEKSPDEPKKIIQEVFYERIFNQLDKSRNFSIQLSGARQWIDINPNTIAVKAVGEDDWSYDSELVPEENIKALDALEISFKVPVNAPAITNYNPEVLEGVQFDTPDPVIKFILNDKKQPFIYSFLQALQLDNVQINVKVNKYKSIKIEDETSSQFENRNAYPFGVQPRRGTYFNIIAPELFKKHLTTVDIHIDWDNMPKTKAEFMDVYKNYKEPLNPAEIKVQIGALSNYEIELDFDEQLIFPLFTSTEGDMEIIDVTPLEESHYHLSQEAINLLQIVPNYDLPDTIVDTSIIDTGYFVVELIEPKNAFYANIYQNEINEALNKNITDPKAQKKFPQEPVVPFIRNMYVSYEAEAKFNVAFGDTNVPEQIFHIHPFGQEAAYKNGSPVRNYMLPKYTDDGYFFIGLKDVNAPETITLYFQLSSEDTKEQTLKTVPKIEWMYLSENRFIPFDDSKIIYDTTYGFTESGLVKLSLPFAIRGQNTIIDSDLTWLVAKVNGDVERLNKAIYVAPHGVLAEWEFDEEHKERLGTIVDPDRIQYFYANVAAISNITQPFESFGGRTPETIKDYNCRIAELIRHKNRAVTHWDLERIVLHLFPNVFQAKTVSHLSDPLDKAGFVKKDYVFADDGENIEYNGIKHGEGIKIVVIPKQEAFKRTKTPKFSLYRLLSIQRLMNQLTSPFMHLEISNPKYEYIRIIANVKFIDNYNNGLTLNRLYEDIDNYIAPWLNDESKSVKIGGSINENVLQNFIKGLSYVKFLTKFSILHIIEEDGLFKLQDTAMEKDIVSIIKAKPWGVLLPDDHHEVEMIEYEEEEEPVSRVNSDEIIRFQNKVNILGDKKYIKIKNPKIQQEEQEDKSKKSQKNISITI